MLRTRLGLLAFVLIACCALALLARNVRRGYTQGLDSRLIAAVSRGDAVATARLLQQGANVNAQSGSHAALWIALTADHPDCARLLLEHGADTRPPADPGGETLLMLAANERFGALSAKAPVAVEETEQRAVVLLLFAHGADVNASDVNGETALMWAAAHDHAAVVEELLAHGAAVNATDHFGQTALILASAGGNTPIVRTLMAHGTALSPASPTYRAALQVARKYRHFEIVHLLFSFR